jgi:hypothetical protein
VLRRWRAKRPLFTGDRGHVYDQLVDRAWSAERATLACIVVQVALALIAIAVAQLSDGAAVTIAASTIVVVAGCAIPIFTSSSRTAT